MHAQAGMPSACGYCCRSRILQPLWVHACAMLPSPGLSVLSLARLLFTLAVSRSHLTHELICYLCPLQAAGSCRQDACGRTSLMHACAGHLEVVKAFVELHPQRDLTDFGSRMCASLPPLRMHA